MAIKRAKPVDRLYDEVREFDPVLMPDPPLASNLNRRLDPPEHRDVEGVETMGTVAILGAAVRTEHLAGQEAIDIVDEMIDAGWYCSTDLYTRIVRRLRDLDADRS